MTKRERYAIQLVIEDDAPKYGGDGGEQLIEVIKDCVLVDYENHTLISASTEEVGEGERVRALWVVPDD
jgi:hypothetical protein